jgi:hypothetical protein
MSEAKRCTQVSGTYPPISRPKIKYALAGKVPFEVLLYYAKLQRKREDETFSKVLASEGPKRTIFGNIFKSKKNGPEESAIAAKPPATVETSSERPDYDEKDRNESPTVSAEERVQANRAIRTATWISVFYLITTE